MVLVSTYGSDRTVRPYIAAALRRQRRNRLIGVSLNLLGFVFLAGAAYVATASIPATFALVSAVGGWAALSLARRALQAS